MSRRLPRPAALSPFTVALATAGAALAAAGTAGAAVPSKPPMVLPGTATAGAASAGTGAAPGWVVGARPGARTAELAAAYGARRLTDLGTYLVPTVHARKFADGLRKAGLLAFAEPNARRRPSAFDAAPAAWSRGAIATPALAVPPLSAKAQAGIIDQRVDTTRPDLANVTVLPGSVAAVEGGHGTEGASIIGGAANNEGILGTYPGVRINAFGVPINFGCAESAAGINAVRKSGVAALNMSYGSPSPCFAEYRELQYALANGVVAVAAAGNEFQNGNPVTYPAALPHVLSVAAVGMDLKVSYFSGANAAIDLAAPGELVPADTPIAFDDDGTRDGLTLVDGTSFAAPAVTGAAAFVKAARPKLKPGQIADLLRASATDIDAKGYDANTGYGLVNLDKAITAPTPKTDPLEPNDEIMWVDGAAFKTADKPVYDGRKTATINASVDQVEDPLDVYRIKIPARSRVSISLKPKFGDPDLEVFRSTAKTASDSSRRLDASHRNGTATDSSGIVNRGKRFQIAYVVVAIDPRVKNLAATYTLTVKKRAFK